MIERLEIIKDRFRLMENEHIDGIYGPFFEEGREIAENILEFLIYSDGTDYALNGDIGYLKKLNSFFSSYSEENEGKKTFLEADNAKTEKGKLLSAFLYEMFTENFLEQDQKRCAELLETFIQLYCLFLDGIPDDREVKNIIYSYVYDYCPDMLSDAFEEVYLGTHKGRDSYLKRYLMNNDFTDPSSIYRGGYYVSDEIMKEAEFLSGLPEETIRQMAYSEYEGYKKGFLRQGKRRGKLSEIRFEPGFERVMKILGEYIHADGFDFSVPRKRQNIIFEIAGSQGLISPVNRNLSHLHAYDKRIVMGKKICERILEERKNFFLRHREISYSGPLVQEAFGEKDLKLRDSSFKNVFSDYQRELTGQFRTEYTALTHRFIHEEERSFVIIAWPWAGGEYSSKDDFKEIFDEILKINTLPEEIYDHIQEKMIETLNGSDHVRVRGRDGNETDLCIRLLKPSSGDESAFENCLSDVNIPLGEVFTTPVLKETSGLLHVKNVYINGISFKDLKISFKDGRVTDYSSLNFPDPEESKNLIRRIIFGEKEFLPMGEFAIGTNTRAYSLQKKFDLGRKMPILIAEKTGPHFAVGDTCYSFMEDMDLRNPDGKRLIAKDNEVSALRKESAEKAYFGVHTDITVPYSELGEVYCVKGEEKIMLLKDGRFILPGTEYLNEALDLKNEKIKEKNTGFGKAEGETA